MAIIVLDLVTPKAAAKLEPKAAAKLELLLNKLYSYTENESEATLRLG